MSVYFFINLVTNKVSMLCFLEILICWSTFFFLIKNTIHMTKQAISFDSPLFLIKHLDTYQSWSIPLNYHLINAIHHWDQTKLPCPFPIVSFYFINLLAFYSFEIWHEFGIIICKSKLIKFISPSIVLPFNHQKSNNSLHALSFRRAL